MHPYIHSVVNLWKTEKKIMKRSHILEERRKLVNPDIRKSVTEVFDRIDAASDDNDEPQLKV